MGDYELDRMIEDENARIWEEQTAEPVIDRTEVDYELGRAWGDLSEACSRLADAAEKAEGHPAEDRILSVLGEVGELQEDIRKLRERLLKEVKSA